MEVEPKVVVEESITERLALSGGSYYDPAKDEIHILTPTKLYLLALKHEVGHRRQIARFGRFFYVLYRLVPTEFEKAADRRAWEALR